VALRERKLESKRGGKKKRIDGGGESGNILEVSAGNRVLRGCRGNVKVKELDLGRR